ncbi:MAG: hypothetical protein EPO63_07300 [Candidatus Nitrosotenuis sp.]|nr:MAG: hypothetical protein EPO63_07300 [Candidatus Nitrosotenuis sp.]
MNSKLAVLAVFALSVGLISNAYAHKEQVVGIYAIEAGWTKKSAVVGKSNSIEVVVTTASMSDKAASDKMMKEMKGMTGEQMANMDHSKMSGSGTAKTGITGLKLNADITIDGKKTMLKLVEDKKTKGKYSAAFTPKGDGYPTIHIVGKIKNTPVEVSFHPEKIEKPTKK